MAEQSRQILAGTLRVLPPAGEPDMLYIEVDGTGVPMVPAAVSDRAGKGEDGRARTREVKLACLFTQTKTDEHGRPVRDPGTCSYVHTFEPAEAFTTLAHAEALRRGADHVRQLVVLGDGAAWIWKMANKDPARSHPDRRYLPRLRTRPRPRPATGRCTRRQPRQLAGQPTGRPRQRRHRKPRGRHPPPAPDRHPRRQVGIALDYFKKNAQRIRYDVYRERGMFIGSGVVGAGCKTVVGRRLKLSGMRWNIPGATSILTLRCHRESGRWDQIWPQPNNQINPATSPRLRAVTATTAA